MLWKDARHAIRGLLRQPGFALVTILTLALGIGATSAVFSALYHTLLHPLPYRDDDRLVFGWMEVPGSGMEVTPGPELVRAWQGRARSFDFITMYVDGEYMLRGAAEPQLVAGAAIDRRLPSLLGEAPIIGRTFTSEETQPNGPRVVLLSEGLWRRRYGARRDVLGTRLQLGDDTYQVVGVLPNAFGAFRQSSREGQVWLPLAPGTEEHVSTVLKLRQGVTLGRADAELAMISKGVAPQANMPRDWTPKLRRPREFVDATTQRGLPILFAGVALVLLIACANIAGLLLVRLGARRREVALRAALGATRGSIARLLGVESLLLAIGGGALGVLLGDWVMDLVRIVRPADLNSLDTMHVDGTTLLFAAGITVLTSALFGMAPALSAARSDLLQPLQAGGGDARTSARAGFRSVLVTAQIALSLVLLVASLLLVRSVLDLRHKDVGFQPDGVLTFRLPLPATSYPDSTTRHAFYDQLLPLLRRLPGVTAVASATGVPTQGGVAFGDLEIADRALQPNEQVKLVNFTGASAQYARALGLRLRQGRFFRPTETGNVIVINESWARKLWPDGSAIGKRLRLNDKAPWDEVVGVVADVAMEGPKYRSGRPLLIEPAYYQWDPAFVVLHTFADPISLAPAIRHLVANLDAKLLPRDFATMNARLADSIALDRFFMQLLTTFAALALLLSAIGLYGVISHAVGQRTREIGIRLALGATPHAVHRMVLLDGARLTVAGLGIGVVVALVAVRLIRSSLSGVKPWDPVSFAGAIVLVAAVAVGAALLPARRAVRVDPLTALRAE